MQYNYFVDISSVFFLTFIIGTALSSVIENTLDWMNSDKGDISKKLKVLHKIHPLMKKFFSRKKVLKAQEYNTEKNRFGDFSDNISSGIALIMMLCGISPFILHTIIMLLPSCHTTVHYIVFCLVLKTVKTLFGIPFGIYDTFHIEEKYGFNKTTKKTFIVDNIKGFVVSAVLGIVAISVMNYVLTEFGPFSAYKVCALVGGMIVFGMFLEFLHMTVLIRIFNKLSPLTDKGLSRKIKRLMEAYGYKAKDVYVMDASKRSSKANAFIGGFGKSKKIVLFDTLLKDYTNDELIAILGHELAHGKLHHLFYNRIISAATTLATVFIVFTMAYNINLYHAFGYNFVNESNIMEYSLVGFVLASMVVGAVKWVLDPLEAWFSRKCEYAADRYSVYYTRKKSALISSLIKLTSDNCGDAFPNKWYESWNYSHPSIMNRINAIKKIGKPNAER